MHRRHPRALVAALFVVAALLAPSSASAVQIPIAFGPVAPVGKTENGSIPQVRAESPFTIRAEPKELGAPATYSWDTDGGPIGSCGISSGTVPEVTLTLPAGHYDIGICVTEEGDGGASHCYHELDVIPAGPIADFSLSGPSALDLQTFREDGASIGADWTRTMEATYSAELLVNFDGRSSHSYPLQFAKGGGKRVAQVTSGSSRVPITIAAPRAGSPVAKVLRRAETKPKEHIGAQIFVKPNITQDPLWGSLQNEFTFGATIPLD